MSVNEYLYNIISLLSYVFNIGCYSWYKHNKKQNNIINEKDSCIYELNEKLIMQNIEVEKL